jgi:hypothetical protein
VPDTNELPFGTEVPECTNKLQDDLMLLPDNFNGLTVTKRVTLGNDTLIEYNKNGYNKVSQ